MRTVDPTIFSLSGDEPNPRQQIARAGVRADGLEGQLRSSFMDALREYLEESTLEGIKYASHVETIKPLRHIYIVMMVSLLIWGLCVLAYFNYDYQHRPPLQVQMVQSSPEFPVDFPAVGICGNSIISEMQLNKLAAYLASKSNNATYELHKILDNLKKFASLVTLRESDVEMLNFMQFLHYIRPDTNITDLMYMLSPKCSAMLSWCRWRGRELPCEKLFATRLTPIGFCCLFNSRYQPEDMNTPPKVLDLAGQNYGLTVTVLQNSSDFAVVRQPSTEGLTVLLFDGGDYPLIEGGAVRGYNVGANSSVYFQLTAHVQYVTKDLKGAKAQRRRCHVRQPFGPRSSKSSYSWCLAECRLKAIAAICNCQPFWSRILAPEVVCTPEHLYCLNKHREKFIYYYPGQVTEEGLDEELQNSLVCNNCMPDCARVLHLAKVFHLNYYYPRKLFTNTRFNLSLVNKSVLRFYYDSTSHNVYRVDLNCFWYEMVALTSCQSVFLVGATIISVAELVFHLTIRWGHHFIRRMRTVPKERQLVFY